MTGNQSEETQTTAAVAVEKTRNPLARWLEDPFPSALLATAATTTAFGFVVTGIWLMSVILG